MSCSRGGGGYRWKYRRRGACVKAQKSDVYSWYAEVSSVAELGSPEINRWIMLRHPQAKTGRGVHPSRNARAKLRYLPGEDSSCLGTAVNSVDQRTWAQPAAMARLTGGELHSVYARKDQIPSNGRVTVGHVDLMASPLRPPREGESRHLAPLSSSPWSWCG